MDHNHVRIIIDSTVDLSKADKRSLAVVPLTVHFSDKEYIDGVTIDHQMFYEMLAACDELPTTSQGTPDAFLKAFKPVVDRGEKAIVITISSKLSGTFQSAMLAAQEYPDNIFVVDSRNASIGSGVLAEYAIRLAESAMSAEEIFVRLISVRDNIRTIATVDTLEYLKKGGRLSTAEAFVGGVLSIKPIISIEDGVVKTLGKARGNRQAGQALLHEIEKTGGIDPNMPIIFGYTGLDETPIRKFVSDNLEAWPCSEEEYTIAAIGSVIGVHAGPGAVAVSFFCKGNI